ncbi:hypothetical protein L2E82_14845 [Cichorium intybus]|uniref:Uncharacterized protein n=1 Tax=Cichorium intybus TaxID=13427 RepID=A0ACB9F0I1_CICIN|nr:hypothetical protein L2E82_14845 [Cichorium intybus]
MASLDMSLDDMIKSRRTSERGRGRARGRRGHGGQGGRPTATAVPLVTPVSTFNFLILSVCSLGYSLSPPIPPSFANQSSDHLQISNGIKAIPRDSASKNGRNLSTHRLLSSHGSISTHTIRCHNDFVIKDGIIVYDLGVGLTFKSQNLMNLGFLFISRFVCFLLILVLFGEKLSGIMVSRVELLDEVQLKAVCVISCFPVYVWSENVGSSASKDDNRKEDLMKLKYQENSEMAVQCVSDMVTNALIHIEDCLKYISELHDHAIFRFCAIPQIVYSI